MTDLRPQIAVVGAGIRGSMFGAAIDQHPRARLAALCDSCSDVVARVADQLRVPAYADLAGLLAAHPAVTAAVIATPDDAHLDAAITCLEAGLDLLIEKPLATSNDDAIAICETAERNGRAVAVGFENRWNPRFTVVQQALASGRHGRVVNQVVSLNDTIFVPTQMLSWAARSSPAWFLMPHSLDLAIWLSHTTPVSVFARGVRKVLTGRGVDTWDAISAIFEMSDGAMLVLNSSWVLSEAAPSVFDFRYEVQTELSTFKLDIADSGVVQHSSDGAHFLQSGVHHHRDQTRGIPIDMVNDWVDKLNGDDVALPDARHGALVTRAIEAVHTSLDTGQPVAIDETHTRSKP